VNRPCQKTGTACAPPGTKVPLAHQARRRLGSRLGDLPAACYNVGATMRSAGATRRDFLKLAALSILAPAACGRRRDNVVCVLIPAPP